MIVQDIKNTIFQYDNFEIWDIVNIDDFFKGNGVIREIFEKEYKIPIANFHARRAEIMESDGALMAAILDMVNDKYFYLFTKNDDNHNDLIYLQESGVMNFGLNIANISDDHVYVVIMDKQKKAGIGL